MIVSVILMIALLIIPSLSVVLPEVRIDSSILENDWFHLAFACIQPPNEGYTPPGGGTTLNHWYSPFPSLPSLDSSLSRYHDPITGECRELKYQGYGGNANNFQTKDHCESYCKQSESFICSFVILTVIIRLQRAVEVFLSTETEPQEWNKNQCIVREIKDAIIPIMSALPWEHFNNAVLPTVSSLFILFIPSILFILSNLFFSSYLFSQWCHPNWSIQYCGWSSFWLFRCWNSRWIWKYLS